MKVIPKPKYRFKDLMEISKEFPKINKYFLEEIIKNISLRRTEKIEIVCDPCFNIFNINNGEFEMILKCVETIIITKENIYNIFNKECIYIFNLSIIDKNNIAIRMTY